MTEEIPEETPEKFEPTEEDFKKMEAEIARYEELDKRRDALRAKLAAASNSGIIKTEAKKETPPEKSYGEKTYEKFMELLFQ